jgi:DNA-binding response OmpR family regulator
MIVICKTNKKNKIIFILSYILLFCKKSSSIKILNLLFLNLNKVVKRSEIIDKIWEWTGNDVNDNTVTVYLKRIREKIKTDIIITIKGIGYRIDSEVY